MLQLLAIYSLISLAWLQPWWQQRWWLAGVISFTLVLIPVWQTQATVFRVTVLATEVEPVMVIQEYGQVTLINSGDADTVRFTVLPFLQQQGINHINWAIATNTQSSSSSGWLELLKRVQVKNFYSHVALESNTTINSRILTAVQARWGKHHFLSAGQTVSAGSTTIQLIDAQAPMLQLKVQGQPWLLLENLENEQNKLDIIQRLSRVQVLCWTGASVDPNLLKAIKSEVAIASSATLDAKTMSILRQNKTQVLLTGRDGAIQWTPGGKFEVTLVAPKSSDSVL